MSKSTARQIMEDLRGRILNGTYLPGERLPTSLELAGMYGVEPVLVQVAVSSLHHAGLLHAHGGRSVVAGDPFAEVKPQCAYRYGRPGLVCPNSCPQFLVKYPHTDDSEGRLACWDHLQNVIWQMREDRSGWEGHFVVFTREWEPPG